MIRERREPSGLVTRYDPIGRSMSVIGLDGRPVSDFDQTMIGNPLRVVLEIESFCSSNCRYCSEGAKPGSIRIPKEKAFSLIDEVEELKVHELTIRGGEATEHPDFYEIWDRAASKEFLTTNVISNGMRFDSKSVERVLSNPRSKLIASLDGFKEINSFHRNPKQYDLIMGWLPGALERHPDQVVVLSCLYRQNYSQIPEFAKFLAGMGVRHYHLPPLKRLGRSELAENNFVSLNEINSLQARLDDLRGEFPEFKPVVSCTALDKLQGIKVAEIPVPLFNEIYYGTGMKVLPEGGIMVNRGIMFTDRFKNGVRAEVSLDPLGNIYSGKSLRDIWRESLGTRVEQGKLADKNYGYYLGWLKSLDGTKT